MRKLILAILLVSLIPSAFAQDFGSVLNELDGMVIPGPFDTFVGNERVNIIISLERGGNLELFAVTQNGVVTDVGSGSVDDPTLTVTTSEETINQIANSQNPAEAAQNALSSGKISYKANGLLKSIKFGLAGVAVKLFGFLL